MKNHDWDDYEKAANKGPLTIAFKALVGLIIFSIPVWFVTRACSVTNEVANVAQEQFGARESLRKYEWFKDAAAQLEAKQATMSVYDKRFADLKAQYGETPRGQWARDDREQSSIWASEAAGVRGSYNTLAAEYNAQMSKFNWRFAEAGRLPEGADRPLPREFKPYVEN